MIDQINLSNFKSFKAKEIGLRSLTLFAGANASGKSTIIQSLLLFKQADLSKKHAVLHLNGDYIKLGSSGGLLHKWADSECIEIELKTSGGNYSIEKLIESGADDTDAIETQIDSSDVDRLQQKIRYLSANRITPGETFPYSALRVGQRDLGPNGEHAIAYLSKNQMAPISIASLRHSNDANVGAEGSLLGNVNAWMQEISTGVDVTSRRIPGTSLAELRFGFSGSGKIDDISSHNVGFGLTYTLPIVVLVLSSQPGDIIVVENPEAHVHPAGQIALGRLLATAACHGVQVIIETHSDHLFNGMRLYIKDNPEEHEKFMFYFVDREIVETGGFESIPKQAAVSKQGKFTSSPNGFFDAWEKALLELVRP